MDTQTAVRLGLTMAAFAVWWHLTAPEMKVLCIVYSALYSMVEYNWTRNTVYDPSTGLTRISPLGGVGHTTIQQFVANVLYMPLLTQGYADALPKSVFVRIALFPFNIWLLEIVEGYCLMALYGGKNPAWTYEGPYARFHNNVNLSFLLPWLALGFVTEVDYAYGLRYHLGLGYPLAQ